MNDAEGASGSVGGGWGSPRAVDWRFSFVWAIGGALAMFLVQPPVDWWPLAWVAPIPWLWLVLTPTLTGRVSWFAVWCGGFLYWLLAIHWLILPHPPATAIGWVILSAYLGCYLPWFVWAARRLFHDWKWPLVPSAAVAWVATDLVRSELLGGFTFAGLGHTQWRWTAFIQVADTVSAVGVGGIVMVAAAAMLVTVMNRFDRRTLMREAVPAVVLVALTLAYGQWRLATAPVPAGKPLDVLLVQGSIDTELKHDPEAAPQVLAHYDEITMAGLAADEPDTPDLIVWPETMWRFSLLEIDPAGGEGDHLEDQLRVRATVEAALARYAQRYGTTWIVGLDRQRITPAVPAGYQSFNAALFLDATGEPLGCYDKMFPVMFGE